MNEHTIIARAEERLRDGTGRAMEGTSAWSDGAFDECTYLTEDGRRCVVGDLLSEDQARLLVTEGVGTVVDLYNILVVDREDFMGPDGEWIVAHVDLLTALQLLHDSSASWRFVDSPPRWELSDHGEDALARIKKTYT